MTNGSLLSIIRYPEVLGEKSWISAVDTGWSCGLHSMTTFFFVFYIHGKTVLWQINYG